MTTLTRNQKNKISTPGYFIKRLRDNKIITLRVFQDYGIGDARRWTVLVDPGQSSVFITCYENLNEKNEILFHLDDGGKKFNRNYFIKTHSIEVIIKELLEKGVAQTDSSSNFFKEKPGTTSI